MNTVKLVGLTKPMLQGPMCEANAEEFIAYCARVSNPANQDNPDSEKLLKYLVKHKHWSPFEMVHIVMEIQTTRDIGRQILRHRSFSFQEFSQRYASVTEMSEPREARLQDQKNRQNSIETDDLGLSFDWITIQNDLMRDAQNAYEWAIENGIDSTANHGKCLMHFFMHGIECVHVEQAATNAGLVRRNNHLVTRLIQAGDGFQTAGQWLPFGGRLDVQR